MRARINRDWTQGSIVRNLWSLSWPMIINNSINTIGPTVDMIWVGRLGADSIAGVGVSGLIVMVVNSLLSGLFTGTMAMVARFIGAGDEKSANRVAQQAYVVGAGFSILMALVGIFLAKPMLRLLGVDPAVVSDGAVYLEIQLIGIITLTAVQVSQSIMLASGDALNPLKISIGFRLLQVGLCPLLVFGWGVIPRLGVSGAALSNVITQTLGGILATSILLSGRTRIKITFRNFAFDGNIIWRTVKIGLPAAFTWVQRSLAELVLVWFIAPFGTVAVAAQSLSQRIDQFLQNLSGGFGNAAGVLSGQSLGARQPERAERTGWLSVAMATGVSLLCAMVIWFWVVPLLHLFNNETDLVDMAATFLRIQIVSYLVWGLVVALSLVLNGVGDTLIPMLTNLTTMVFIQLGLAYVLSHYTGLGVYGVRWAVVIGIIARAVIYPIYFKGGRWKHQRV
jgi:putative MATE family efflux protein